MKNRLHQHEKCTQPTIETVQIANLYAKTTPTTPTHTSRKNGPNKKRIVVNGYAPPLVRPSDADDIFQVAPATGHYGCITAAAELQDAAAHFSWKCFRLKRCRVMAANISSVCRGAGFSLRFVRAIGFRIFDDVEWFMVYLSVYSPNFWYANTALEEMFINRGPLKNYKFKNFNCCKFKM